MTHDTLFGNGFLTDRQPKGRPHRWATVPAVVSLYQLKRAALMPVIRYRRARTTDVTPAERHLLELSGYSRAIRLLMATKAIDPALLHRADLDADSVAVDVGAYLGDGAAQIHDLYGCRVYAFEPNPNAFEALEARFADIPEVRPVPYGLGARDATVVLDLDGPGSSMHGVITDSTGTAEVPIRDIAAAFEELGIDRVDFMKVNIEGAEYDLFDRFIAEGWLHRTRYLLIQFHEWHHDAYRRRRRIRRALRRSHDLVWDYPWIWELWCSKAEPHPAPPEYDAATLAEISKALVAEAAQRNAAASGDGTRSPRRAPQP